MRRIAVVCLLCLSVAACGEDGESTQTPPPTPTPAPTPTPTPPPQPTNRAPAITSATITPGFGLAFFTTFQLSGSATDADGDALTVAGQMQPTVDITGTISNTTALFGGVPINGLAVTLSPQ